MFGKKKSEENVPVEQTVEDCKEQEQKKEKVKKEKVKKEKKPQNTTSKKRFLFFGKKQGQEEIQFDKDANMSSDVKAEDYDPNALASEEEVVKIGLGKIIGRGWKNFWSKIGNSKLVIKIKNSKLVQKIKNSKLVAAIHNSKLAQKYREKKALRAERKAQGIRRDMNVKKTIMVTVAVTVVVLIIGTVVTKSLMPEPLMTVKVEIAQLRDIDQTLKTSGYVESNHVKTYYSPVSAVVSECNVEEGSLVSEGDMLAVFDVSDLELEARRAELSDKAEQSGYENTLQVDSDSDSKLTDIKKEIDDYEDKIENTEDEIERLEASIKSANAEVNYFDNLGVELNEQQIQGRNTAQKNLSDYQSQLESAQKKLAEYQTNLADRKSEKMTAEAGLISDAQKEQIEAQKELSQLNKDTASSQLEVAQSGIMSEFSGLVTEVSAQSGAMVAEGAPLCTVSDLSNVKVTVNLTKNNLLEVEEGQEADITIAGEEYTGTVNKINRKAEQNSSGVPVITAEVLVEDAGEDVYLGIEADVVIYTASAVDAVAVPVKALNQGKHGYFCYVVCDGFVEKREVSIGASDGTYVEVLDGVEEEEEVVIEVTPEIEEGIEVCTEYEDDETYVDEDGEIIKEDEETDEEIDEEIDEDGEEYYDEESEGEDEEYEEYEEYEDEDPDYYFDEDEEDEEADGEEDEEYEDDPDVQVIEDEDTDDNQEAIPTPVVRETPTPTEDPTRGNKEESEEGEYQL